MELKGLLFVLVGPSGSGKNTLINDLREHSPGNLRQLPTATTRPKRQNETDGVEHFFLSESQFQDMIRNDALVEYQFIHNAGFYGTPRAEVEKALANGENLLADIDIYGASSLKNLFPQNVVLIFIAPPSHEALATRIRARQSNTDQEIQKRLERADTEMAHALKMDYVIINDDLEKAAILVRKIVEARCLGKPLETQIPVIACAWVTRNTPDGLVLGVDGKLPCYTIENVAEAGETLQKCLQNDLHLQVQAAESREHALYIHYIDGEMVAEMVLALRALHEPVTLTNSWHLPEALSIPFHVKARFAMPQASLS